FSGLNPTQEFQGIKGLTALYIIRNGLPVFQADFSKEHSLANEDETLVSGFLSALDSFMKDMKSFGDMKELKTSGNFKFTFHEKDSLLFVACSKDDLEQGVIKSFLYNVSSKFLQLYQKHLNRGSMIVQKDYENFNTILQRDILSKHIRESLERKRARCSLMVLKPRLLIPATKIMKDYFIRGPLPDKILPHVDGKKDFDEISRITGLDVKKVTQFCKYLVKEGVLAIDRS
ncbi:MAG: hypothetical protein ACTSVI_10180, partial [Promethearchaeota archaeon]